MQLIMQAGQRFDRLVHDDNAQAEDHEIPGRSPRTVDKEDRVKKDQGDADRSEELSELARDFIGADDAHRLAD